jgi:hypothetical protein
MKRRATLGLATLLLAAATVVSYGQDKAAVRMEKPGPIRPGGSVVFNIKLNEPLPTGAHFDFRISPVSADEEIPWAQENLLTGLTRSFESLENFQKAHCPVNGISRWSTFSCLALAGPITPSSRMTSGSTSKGIHIPSRRKLKWHWRGNVGLELTTCLKGEKLMAKEKTIEFDAHKTVKRPTEVEFTTENGKKGDFIADKPTKVPVHVKFKKKS